MIRRILEQEKAIRQVLGSDRKTTHLIPNWQDVDVMESVDKVLVPLSEFTNILSMEHSVTVSSLKPLLHHLRTEVLIQKENDTELTKTLKQKIISSLLRRYNYDHIDNLLDKATFVDPRFRLEYTDSEHIPTIKHLILQEAVELEKPSQDSSPSVPSRVDPENPPAAKKKRKLGMILKRKDVDSADNLSTEYKAQKEMERERYLVIPKLDTEEYPLVWLKQNCSAYPLLSKIAKKYFK